MRPLLFAMLLVLVGCGRSNPSPTDTLPGVDLGRGVRTFQGMELVIAPDAGVDLVNSAATGDVNRPGFHGGSNR
jgi:hypothetical protein